MQPSCAGREGGQFYPRQGVIISCALQAPAPGSAANAGHSPALAQRRWLRERPATSARSASETCQANSQEGCEISKAFHEGCGPPTRAMVWQKLYARRRRATRHRCAFVSANFFVGPAPWACRPPRLRKQDGRSLRRYRRRLDGGTTIRVAEAAMFKKRA